ncbi:MAG TPA: PEGA domain-containing protein [Nannocystaceae bacterium]|nr:PEGA domain-containing protein [Nannocystaceae bacterium]
MATASELLSALPLALAVALAPVHADARAPERHIVAMPLVVEGTLPENVRKDLGARFVKGLGGDADPADANAATCTDAACWQSRAGELGASHFVVAKLTVADRDYDVQAELIDGTSGKVLASAARRCEICGYDEVAETVDDVAGLLRRKLGAASATLPVLAVKSTPPGALVTVDGERVGTTPLQIDVAPGAHDVRVSKLGYVAKLERVVMVEGVRQDVEATLAIAPDEERARGRSGMRIGGAVATAIGLAGLGVGIGLAVLDENPIKSRCGGDNKDIEGNCKYRYDSLGAGIAIAVVGGAALATGIALLIVDRKRDRARRVAVRPSAYGIAIRF